VQRARALCDKESLHNELEFLNTTFKENRYILQQIQAPLRHSPGICPDNIELPQQNGGQTQLQECWPATMEDLQLPPSCDGQPAVEDSRYVRYPLSV